MTENQIQNYLLHFKDYFVRYFKVKKIAFFLHKLNNHNFFNLLKN